MGIRALLIGLHLLRGKPKVNEIKFSCWPAASPRLTYGWDEIWSRLLAPRSVRDNFMGKLLNKLVIKKLVSKVFLPAYALNDQPIEVCHVL